ncbi:MAG: SprT-like domain-containing protein [Alphaproteobacteria bacterium]
MTKVSEMSGIESVARKSLTVSPSVPEITFPSYDKKNGRGPTVETYGALQYALDVYNGDLFDGCLPHCLITLHRSRRAFGYFWGNKFAETDNPQNLTNEIALNPALMVDRSDEEILSTFVHELTHHWQFYFSKKQNRRLKCRTYHDLEWARKMEEIGLIPSDTGKPGGKKTGTRVSHYIEEGGPFQIVTRELLATGFALKWADAQSQAIVPGGEDTGSQKKDQSKRKFNCPSCGQNAWANHTARLVCGNRMCGGEPMQLN